MMVNFVSHPMRMEILKRLFPEKEIELSNPPIPDKKERHHQKNG
jgi:hypothetical protein